MSIVPADSLEQSELAAPGARWPLRRDTSHLKLSPESPALREQIRKQSTAVAARLDRSRPPCKVELESHARAILAELGEPEGYVGWTMVALVTEFWRSEVAAAPPGRRLFLLPPCPVHDHAASANGSNGAARNGSGADACGVAQFRRLAEGLGYRTLVVDSSPPVLKAITSGYADAVVGAVSLDVLERAIDKILLAGIPCMAVPFLAGDCHDALADADAILAMIETEHRPHPSPTRTYIHLMRAATRMFEPRELERLAPRTRATASLAELNGQGVAGLDPVAGTEAIAYDFLAKGGKHSRPFITLAVYDALTGGRAALADGAEFMASLNAPVKRAALSIETFHKASLVHDDIEDNDAFRYGDATLHRKYGAPTAINIGDYLIGLGYRLVSRESRTLGPEVAADILDQLADAHMKLSEGQGAELLWRDARDKRLTVADALNIYALKTAPAFEAALLTGTRLAGPVEEYAEPMRRFARHLGVAFQILNDLGDWRADAANKLTAGGDVLGGRPTVLWALALEGLGPAERDRLEALAAERPATLPCVERVRELYQAAGVFQKAEQLVDEHQAIAEAIAADLEPDELRRLLRYLIDTVLERPAA